jgi:hypothetical protein
MPTGASGSVDVPEGPNNASASGSANGAPRSSALLSLLKYARSATPPGLRHALKPIVRTVIPEHLRRQTWELDVSVADRWVGNRYTIEADGRLRHFFFISGCYKSGTNWVQNLLNLHPLVHAVGEFHFDVLTRGIRQLTGMSWFIGSEPRLAEVALDGAELTIRRMMYAATRGKPAATWLGDRTPHAVVPIIRGAPQIHIVRDPRDVLVSWSFHHLRLKDPNLMADAFRAKAAVINASFKADPDGFNPLDGWLGDEAWLRFHARQWADISRLSRQNIPMLREQGTDILEVRYEELHADLDSQRARLYTFLGLNPSEAAAPSAETKTLPGFERENRKSFFRKGVVGDWQNYLDDRVLKIIESELGDELALAGYSHAGAAA